MKRWTPNSTGSGPRQALQRGVAYLLRTQAADGSWHVKNRAMKLRGTSRADSRTGTLRHD
jgi:hypothetical protein